MDLMRDLETNGLNSSSCQTQTFISIIHLFTKLLQIVDPYLFEERSRKRKLDVFSSFRVRLGFYRIAVALAALGFGQISADFDCDLME